MLSTPNLTHPVVNKFWDLKQLGTLDFLKSPFFLKMIDFDTLDALVHV